MPDDTSYEDASDSATRADPADIAVASEVGAAVHYHFPVEIEVRAAPQPVDKEEIVKETLTRLAQKLENR